MMEHKEAAYRMFKLLEETFEQHQNNPTELGRVERIGPEYAFYGGPIKGDPAIVTEGKGKVVLWLWNHGQLSDNVVNGYILKLEEHRRRLDAAKA